MTAQKFHLISYLFNMFMYLSNLVPNILTYFRKFYAKKRKLY